MSDILEYKKGRGFAKLKSYRITKPSKLDIIDLESLHYFDPCETYVIFEAVIHGVDLGIVYVKKSSKKYDRMLEITGCDRLSEITDKYIPVDKIMKGIYKPTDFIMDQKSSYIDIQVMFEIAHYLNMSKYNRKSGKWEGDSDEIIFPYLIYNHKILSSIFIGIMLSIAIIILTVNFTTNTSIFIGIGKEVTDYMLILFPVLSVINAITIYKIRSFIPLRVFKN